MRRFVKALKRPFKRRSRRALPDEPMPTLPPMALDAPPTNNFDEVDGDTAAVAGGPPRPASENGFSGDDDSREVEAGARHRQAAQRSLPADRQPYGTAVEDELDMPDALDEDTSLTRSEVRLLATFVALLAGIAMVAGGAVLTARSRTSDEGPNLSDQYRSAVAAFESSTVAGRSVIAGWSPGFVSGAPAPVGETLLRGVAGLPTTTSVFRSANVPVNSTAVARALTTTYELRFGDGPTGLVTDPIVVVSQDVTSGIECSRASCSAGADAAAGLDCRTSLQGAFVCNSTTLSAQCRLLYGETATYEGLNFCVEAAACGRCRFTGYVDEVCIVVTRQTALEPWRIARDFVSCEYPFTQRRYSPGNRSAAFIIVRTALDPFLAQQSITKGTGSFDAATPSTAPSKAGVALLVIGSVCTITALAVGGHRLWRRCAVAHDSDDGEGDDVASSEVDVDSLPLAERISRANPRELRQLRRPQPGETRLQALYRFERARNQALTDAA